MWNFFSNYTAFFLSKHKKEQELYNFTNLSQVLMIIFYFTINYISYIIINYAIIKINSTILNKEKCKLCY